MVASEWALLWLWTYLAVGLFPASRTRAFYIKIQALSYLSLTLFHLEMIHNT